MIYTPAGDPPSKEQIEKLREEAKRLYAVNEPGARATADRLIEQIERAEESRKHKGPRFSLNLDSELRHVKLGVIDEASMIDFRMGADLESFGTKLLVIGDPAQLPPVYGDGYFTSREPDAFLDEIHRQALDSPILQLADLARHGRPLPVGQIGEGVDVRRYGDPSLEERAMTAEMILVGPKSHAARVQYEDPPAARSWKRACPGTGRSRDLPAQQPPAGVAQRVDVDRRALHAEPRQHDGDRSKCSRLMIEIGWNQCMAPPVHGAEEELDNLSRRDHQEFAFAFAITSHKAQGSARNDVLVFDESKQFGRDAHRHLYTSITRAVKTLTVVV